MRANGRHPAVGGFDAGPAGYARGLLWGEERQTTMSVEDRPRTQADEHLGTLLPQAARQTREPAREESRLAPGRAPRRGAIDGV